MVDRVNKFIHSRFWTAQPQGGWWGGESMCKMGRGCERKLPLGGNDWVIDSSDGVCTRRLIFYL